MGHRTDEWRDIPGYGGKYQADYSGRVRRVYGKSGKTKELTPYHTKMKGSQRLVVKLTKEGRSREAVLMQVIALTFLGERPEGCIPVHKNGLQSDNCAANIEYRSRREVGRDFGWRSRSRAVVKLDGTGTAVDAYRSAREAARRNYMSYQTVTDRCNGKARSVAPDGHDYAWEDSAASLKGARERIRNHAEKNREPQRMRRAL